MADAMEVDKNPVTNSAMRRKEVRKPKREEYEEKVKTGPPAVSAGKRKSRKENLLAAAAFNSDAEDSDFDDERKPLKIAKRKCSNCGETGHNMLRCKAPVRACLSCELSKNCLESYVQASHLLNVIACNCICRSRPRRSPSRSSPRLSSSRCDAERDLTERIRQLLFARLTLCIK
jgi:hypothetical protein